LKLGADLDIKALQQRMPLEAKKLARVVARALNRTALEVQTAERVQLDQSFQIRNAGFMYRLIKINAFASTNQNRPYAEVGIDNTKSRVLLSLFEEGGEKDPAKGKNIAVPLTGQAARPSFGEPVRDQFTFQSLDFKRVRLTATGRQALLVKKRYGVRGRLTSDYYVWAGKNRTFILPSTKQAPFGGVFQRVGPGPQDIRLIYSFRPKAGLKKQISFIERARDVFTAKFAGFLKEEWDKES
jgi:hypothetical protein